MAEAAEAASLLTNVGPLETALKGNYSLITEDLRREGLLKSDIYEIVKDPQNTRFSSADKACMIVASIKDYVELEPANYHKFLKVLKKNGYLFKDIISKLEKIYNEKGGVSPEPDLSGLSCAIKVSSLDPDVREDLTYILECNLDLICEQYASFVAKVCKSIRDRVDVVELRSYLLNLRAITSPSGQQCKLLSDVREELKSLMTVNDIFDFISVHYATFLDYEIFAGIVKEYGSGEDHERLEKYSDSLKEYINKHTIAEFIEINPKLEEVAKGKKKAVFKIDVNLMHQKLVKVYELKKAIAKILGIRPSALQFYSIEEGCVMLTFLVPVFVANEVFGRDKKLTEKQIADLQTLSVKWVKCGEFSFNFEQKAAIPETAVSTIASGILTDMHKNMIRIRTQQSMKQHFNVPTGCDTFVEFLNTEDLGSTYETDGMYRIRVRALDHNFEVKALDSVSRSEVTCTAHQVFQQLGNVTTEKDGSISVIIEGNISSEHYEQYSSDTALEPASNHNLFHTREFKQMNFSHQQLELYQIGVLSHGIKLKAHCTEFTLTNCDIDDKKTIILADSLRYCTSLRKLSLSTNHIRDDGARALADCLRHCTQVRVLDLSFNHIGDTGAMSLAKSLELCTDLCELDLTCNQIGDQGAVALAESTRNIKDLKFSIWNHKITKEGATDIMNYRSSSSLDINTFNGTGIGAPGVKIFMTNVHDVQDKCINMQLEGNSIDYFGAKTLADCLKHFDNLQTLNLEDNNIGSDGAKVLATGLIHCSNLKMLNLKKNNINYDGIKALVSDGLRHCNSLQTLDLERNNIGSDGAKALAEGSKYYSNLCSLNLNWNNISCEGIKALSVGLKYCNNLQILTLDHNSIISIGAKALAGGLEYCINLQMLSLASNSIGSSGAKALAESMKYCKYLHTLNILGNSIGSDGAEGLSGGLKLCSNLQELNLERNSIASIGAQALGGGLKHCINLRTLNLSWNSIDPDGMKTLADGLKYCHKLKTLNLFGNRIGNEGAIVLADSLKHCANLQSLNVLGNSIEPEGAKALADGLKHCKHLVVDKRFCEITSSSHSFSSIKFHDDRFPGLSRALNKLRIPSLTFSSDSGISDSPSDPKVQSSSEASTSAFGTTDSSAHCTSAASTPSGYGGSVSSGCLLGYERSISSDHPSAPNSLTSSGYSGSISSTQSPGVKGSGDHSLNDGEVCATFPLNTLVHDLSQSIKAGQFMKK